MVGGWIGLKEVLSKENLSTKFKAPKKSGPNSKVNIWLVTAEILLTYKVRVSNNGYTADMSWCGGGGWVCTKEVLSKKNLVHQN